MFPYKQYAKIGARPTKIDLLAHARRLNAVFPKTRLSVSRDHEKKKTSVVSSKTRSQDKSPKYQTNTSLSPDSGLKATYPEILEEDTSALNSCRVHENSCS